jgi:hypothetical protein
LRLVTAQFVRAIDERVDVGGELPGNGGVPVLGRAVVEMDVPRDAPGLHDVA